MNTPSPRPTDLTESEMTVLTLLGCGQNVPQIATFLAVTRRTVEGYKRRLYEKLDVGSQSHAVSRAISLGLFDGLLGVDGRPQPPAEGGRPCLVVVHAPSGNCLQSIAQTLLGHDLPFVVTQRADVTGAHWTGWHRGPLTVLLVDPCAASWLLPARLRCPVVLVRSTPPDLAAVLDALRHGAHAVLWGDAVDRDLRAAISLVSRGYFLMSGTYLGTPAWGGVAHRPIRAPDLTDRELHVLDCISSGRTIRQTARCLGVTVKTVESAQSRLFQKLGARNRSEALLIAYQSGVIGPPGGGGAPVDDPITTGLSPRRMEWCSE